MNVSGLCEEAYVQQIGEYDSLEVILTHCYAGFVLSSKIICHTHILSFQIASMQTKSLTQRAIKLHGRGGHICQHTIRKQECFYKSDFNPLLVAYPILRWLCFGSKAIRHAHILS